MSSYLDKTGLERVWSKATNKFATIVTTDELSGRILNLETNSATKQEVSAEVAKLVDSAPETLNTLNELAAALGDDPNFATNMATEIGKKVNSSDYNDTIDSINSHISTINGEIDELQEASEQHLNKEDYLGPIIKEGNPIIYDNGVEGFGIRVETTFSPKQAGSGEPSPDNIRPIVGYDELKLTAVGKNLLPNPVTDGVYGGVTLTRNPDGSIYVRGTCTEEHVIPIWGNGVDVAIDIDDCFISCRPGFGIKVIKADGSEAFYSSDNIYLAPGDKIVWAYFHFHPGEEWDGLVGPQIEIGEEITDYEPYRGSDYAVQTGQTVYGGRMDWLTGKLVAEWAMVTLDGTEDFIRFGDSVMYPHLFVMNSEFSHVGVQLPHENNVSSHYRSHRNNFTECCFYLEQTGKRPYINDIRFTDPADLKAYIAAQYAAGTPVQIVYRLALPVQIQLAPTQISELEGINTLYGDGDSIRAIFKSTGGTSTTLEAISGVLSIEKGGTGAIDAATARSNLGITPANIGAEPTLGFTPVQQGGGEGQGTNTVYIGWATAGDGLKAQVDGVDLGYIMTEHGNGGTLPVHRGGTGATDAATALSNLGGFPKTGGTFIGPVRIKNDGTNGANFGFERYYDGVGRECLMGLSGDKNLFIGIYENGTLKNSLNLLDDTTTFGKPVSITSGGTGATTAEQALANLGGFSKTGGTVNGSITTSKGTEWSTFQNVRTVNGEQRDVSMYISGAGDADFVTGKAGTTVNKMTLGENQTSFMKAVVAPGMIIEQPWGRMSWKVGGVTKAEIIEHFGDSTKDGGLIFRIYSADGSQYEDLYLDYNGGIKGSGAGLTSLNAGNITSGTLAITHGGTGATSKSGARTNLGISSGTSLPSSGTAGDIFFLYS